MQCDLLCIYVTAAYFLQLVFFDKQISRNLGILQASNRTYPDVM